MGAMVVVAATAVAVVVETGAVEAGVVEAGVVVEGGEVSGVCAWAKPVANTTSTAEHAVKRRARWCRGRRRLCTPDRRRTPITISERSFGSVKRCSPATASSAGLSCLGRQDSGAMTTTPAATVVLVHGAWHGAWCFAKTVAALEAIGVAVVAPDLPGHGADTGDRKSVV